MVATTRAQKTPPPKAAGKKAVKKVAPATPVAPASPSMAIVPVSPAAAPASPVMDPFDKASILPFDMQKRVDELPIAQLAELANLAARTLKKTTLNRTQTVMKNAAEKALRVQQKEAKKLDKVAEVAARKDAKLAKKNAKEAEKQAKKEAKLAVKIARANPFHDLDKDLPVKTPKQLEDEKAEVAVSRAEEAKQFGFGMQSVFVNHMNQTDEPISDLRPDLQAEIAELDNQMDTAVCFDGSTRGFGDKAVFEMVKMCSGSLKRKLQDAMSEIAAEAVRKKQLRKSIDNKSYNARRKQKRLAAEAKALADQEALAIADAATPEPAPATPEPAAASTATPAM